MCWGILENSGVYWDVLAYTGVCWNQWKCIGCIGVYCGILKSLGMNCNILGFFDIHTNVYLLGTKTNVLKYIYCILENTEIYQGALAYIEAAVL